eukprot:GHVU01150867.1.p1 GENE.GHVU01150867.1~~GHVU01150867.1.p1  ORF type:complete len:284 (+),score=20.42 GHVU01150867.1:398-1249(+)
MHEIAREYSWVNAIASDSSYLDDLQMDLLGVRARFGIDCEVHSFHLAAVPLFDTHTSDDVMRALKPLLNALDDDWWVKIAGSTTDGENKMTGVHVGVSTQLEQEARDAGATDEFVRIWDPCHQLDLALHRALDGIAGVPDEKTMKRTDILIPESHPTSIYYMKRLRELATTLRAKKYAINATRKTGHHINCPGNMTRMHSVNRQHRLCTSTICALHSLSPKGTTAHAILSLHPIDACQTVAYRHVQDTLGHNTRGQQVRGQAARGGARAAAEPPMRHAGATPR